MQTKATTPNQIVSALYKRHQDLYVGKSVQGMSKQQVDEFYAKVETLKRELAEITNKTGAVTAMSKVSIFKLITMQYYLRFMREHPFYMKFNITLSETSN